MKKTCLLFFSATLCLLACSKKDNRQADASPDGTESNNRPKQRNCGSTAVLEYQMRTNPAFQARRAQIEANLQRHILNTSTERLLANGTIVIPVVVNVIYSGSSDSVGKSQIDSQIKVLNDDYSGNNTDAANIPDTFKRVKAGDTKIIFELKKVNYKKSTVKKWSSEEDKMKTSTGIKPTSPDSCLNIWIVNTILNEYGDPGVLGYAQFPGGSSSTDGVVIAYDCFGTNGKAVAPFNKGRTATHEVGHWLNLYHIWAKGYGTCGTDEVDDTPQHKSENYGCPSYPKYSTCNNIKSLEMTMNYMDYTDDECMNMFTAGQKNRMLATFAKGGGREGFKK